MPARRQLYVLRHAKSSWDEPGLDDHERPLAPRGRRATAALAVYVRANGIRPELVICSPARRTRETLDGVAPGGERLFEPELYSASAADVLERVRRVPETTGSVMVIGHNPAMQILVLRLAKTGKPAVAGSELEAVRAKFPTGALATLSLECEWSELTPGRAALVGLVRPKQLY
jgi:phosphohistidine phosphatase